ncbi:MAG: glycosyltransferase, partial [Nocardia sp.]|nr:glycosyltransferase [Nocardia sp.]
MPWPEPTIPRTAPDSDSPEVCGISVVVPVYRGEQTVAALVRELHTLTT